MNFTWKKLGVLVLAAGIFCSVTAPASAKGPKGMGGHYMEQLSPAQQKQARAILEAGRDQSLREEIAAKKAVLETVVKSPNPDLARIGTLSRELGELRGKELINRMETAEKLKGAGLPEMKKPAKPEKPAGDEQGRKEEFASRRIAQLPEAKQAEARKIYDAWQENVSQTREALKTNRAELEKAMANGDKAAVAALATTNGELKGKLLAAKVELRQNLAKADLPADMFDRDGKKGDRKRDGKKGKKGKKGDFNRDDRKGGFVPDGKKAD